MAESRTKPRKERTENANRRRRQLLDAAKRSILAHGLARTTLATVAEEAGLSQGVAAFYFKSKNGLLAETLRDLYSQYEVLWMGALERAGSDPRDQLSALIATDFEAKACGPKVLPLWFAFWGELRFSAQYAEVAQEFDQRRREALTRVWDALIQNGASGDADELCDWMETLTDGYWQHLHIAPGGMTRARAERAARVCLARLVPALVGSIDADK
ncbi:TetR/AcrR family transcriptional regulator [Pseudohalocynthiibacter aestuariivivens]|uniref:TetR/AcrR family transcriptional regulator n=1 Tax=Roseovarius pelagicus TaxID=2980108 RepID=A0ABY6DDW2_9RHOB|nr:MULTISPECIES: TetR/AcrR family transcriptional regulator [Rhodobacterales]QIE47153.1 TetR/AcrR family transcriptional regulator [Pseudohalocynthiibacter aestuariivivens]UXX84293.1 TetR/AcrR family transcriptional regulator [Roseovarius pelagicus]